ncbi:hypothetical protein WUBG_19033, partial [Wuchereria bancrofti]
KIAPREITDIPFLLVGNMKQLKCSRRMNGIDLVMLKIVNWVVFIFQIEFQLKRK